MEITGKVAGIGGGRFNVDVVGQDSFNLGRAVLLEVGSIKLMVSEFRGHSGNHPIVYQHFGIYLLRPKWWWSKPRATGNTTVNGLRK